MAKVLLLAPAQYLQGQVSLFQGDQWNLYFQINDQYNGVNLPTSLTSASGVTGFFPMATGGVTGVPCSLLDSQNGFGLCVVPNTVTPSIMALSEPTSWYVQVTLPTGLQTIETPDQPLIIGPPSFVS